MSESMDPSVRTPLPAHARVVIVGAGLSGLYAAYLLERHGVTDHLAIEARDTPGGRIASARMVGSEGENINRFDLGPTWFWPELQPELDHLVRHLGLPTFPQHELGDTMVERSPHKAAVRMRGFVNAPASMRLTGGTESLVDRLRHRVDPLRIVTGQRVVRLELSRQGIAVTCVGERGTITIRDVEHVLLAAPPRLIEERIGFTPRLPSELVISWRETATWMAAHAKYVAVYDGPFWRDEGLSGEGRSWVGPLAEIHDATMPGGLAALFGFLGVSARERRETSEEVLKEHCRSQLARLFGRRAASPLADFIKDWAADPFTASAADLNATGDHAAVPFTSPGSGPWKGRVTGIASEWSQRFPGYLAGAVDAANAGVDTLLRNMENSIEFQRLPTS